MSGVMTPRRNLQHSQIFAAAGLMALLGESYALPDHHQIRQQTRTGIVVIDERFTTDPDAGSDNVLVDSHVYFVASSQKQLLMSCKTREKGSSQGYIATSGRMLAVKSVCEELATSDDGGETWNYWNKNYSVYKTGGIEDFKITGQSIQIKYSIPSLRGYDYWTTINGGRSWTKLGSN